MKFLKADSYLENLITSFFFFNHTELIVWENNLSTDQGKNKQKAVSVRCG